MPRASALVLIALIALMVSLAKPASAKVETVAGVLVDQVCYKMDKANTGERHVMKSGPMEECATSCAKSGQPVALVTPDGKVYQVTGDLAANKNAKLLPYLAHTVALTGDVTADKDGSMKIAASSLKTIAR